MKTRFTFLLFICIGFFSFVADNEVSEGLKFKMYLAALQNQSTATNFVVAIVKNKNTGEKKELCVEAPFLEGAISKEKGINIFAAIELAKKQKDRTFEFSNEDALSNLNFSLYTKEEYEKYLTTMDADKIVRQVRNNQLKSKTFPQEGKELNMYAHMLFNHGVMMTRNMTALKTFDFAIFEPK